MLLIDALGLALFIALATKLFASVFEIIRRSHRDIPAVRPIVVRVDDKSPPRAGRKY
jgi:hypothetical protein